MTTEKKSSSLVNVNNYVSTENILPNRGGIRFPAKSLPRISKISSYQKNDILISNIRPYFKKIWFSDRDGVRSNDVLAFRTKNSNILLQKYLYLVLQSDKFFDYVTLTSKGTKMPRGDKNAILNFTFEIPSISIQKKLINYFFVIESKIKLNNLINDNLMEQLENEFHNLFFESFNSKSFTLSTLVIETIAGDWGKTTLQKNFDTKTTIIRGTDFQDITMGRSSNAPTRYVKKKNVINKELQKSDVVVEISGGSPTQSTGRSLLITNEIKNSFKLPILGTNFTRTFKTENLENAVLLKSYLQFLYLKRLFFNYENGTTGIKNLDYKNVLNIKLPDVRTNKLFKNYIKKYILFYKFIIKLGKQNKTLESIKDAFLKLYF